MIAQHSNCINYFNKKILNELNDVCTTWIAGGALRDYFSYGYIKSDIDLYFPNEKEMNKCLKYFTEVNADIDETFTVNTNSKRGKIIYENENVVSITYRNMQLDIVKRYFKTPENAIKEFDFTVSCAAVDREKVYFHETFFIDLAKKALVINKLPHPISTLWRMQKYIKKGFTICKGGLLEIVEAIQKLERDDETSTTIEDQLEFYPDGTPKFIGID